MEEQLTDNKGISNTEAAPTIEQPVQQEDITEIKRVGGKTFKMRASGAIALPNVKAAPSKCTPGDVIMVNGVLNVCGSGGTFSPASPFSGLVTNTGTATPTFTGSAGTAGWTITKLGTGQYNIIHNLGTSNYSIVALAMTGSFVAWVTAPVTLSANNVIISSVYQSGPAPNFSYIDRDFTFILSLL